EPLEIEFQRLQFDARLAGRIREGDRAEVGLARLGADAGKLRANNLDTEFSSRSRVRERLQLLNGGGLGRFHVAHLVGAYLDRRSSPEVPVVGEAMKAVVLLSGGLDSTTALAVARSRGFDCYALSVDYGQRHRVELDRAAKTAKALGAVDHRVMRLDLRQ